MRPWWILMMVGSQSFSQSIDSVSVCTDKTVYVLFGNMVTLVDLGTKLDYAYLVKENMVMLKALKENVKPTSLMIRTTEDVHVWIIRYKKDLHSLLLDTRKKEQATADHLSSESPSKENANTKIEGKKDSSQINLDTTTKGISQKEDRLTERSAQMIPLKGNDDTDLKDEEMKRKIALIQNERQSFRDLGEIANGLFFSLHDLFVDNHYLYIKVGLRNTSSIAFELDLLYFERGQGRTIKKREAYSRLNVPFVFHKSVLAVHPGCEETMVYVLDLFAFKDKDSLLVRVNEKGGVRSLQFSIPAKEIINAKSI